MSEEATQVVFDDGLDDCPPNLYVSERVADGVRGFAAIGDAEAAFFHTYGYLVVHDAFDAEEVQSTLTGLLDLIDGKVPGYRGIQFEGRAREFINSLERDKKQDFIRKLWKMVEFEPRVRAMAHHPALIATIERLMGEPPDLFQDQALIKPPLIGREKPWHQDNAYFNLPPETTVVGAWIALDEATAENGCMFIIPGSHQSGPVVHFKRRDWQICDTDVAVGESMMVPLKPGGCLLFHGLLHHGTPPSRSERRRRAVQFHYKPRSAVQIAPDARLAVFGSEGKDVTC